MKKALLIICAVLLMTGCGSENDKVKIGTIQYMDATEETIAEIRGELVKANLIPSNQEYVFFSNMSTMLAALQSGQIAAMTTYEAVADYLITQNQNLEWKPHESGAVDMFCCAMLEKNVALKDEFDKAIKEMQKDGTLATLVKTYISAHVQEEASPSVEMPTFYDAPVIKIGVTGDLPKMDYVLPDGIPAGFNTAVLAEISRRIGKNFMLVQVDSGARAAALVSGEVDVIFWSVFPKGMEGIPAGYDRPAGMIFTEPYFSDGIGYVRLKK